MNELTDLRSKLISALGAIQASNGFYTNAGNNVRTGWFDEIIQSEHTSSPVIVVQRGKNGIPQMDAGELVLRIGYLIVGAVSVGLDDYEAALDDLEHDIWSALCKRGTRNIPWAPFGAYQLEFDEPLTAPPGGGTQWASLAIPVTFKIIINRHE